MQRIARTCGCCPQQLRIEEQSEQHPLLSAWKKHMHFSDCSFLSLTPLLRCLGSEEHAHFINEVMYRKFPDELSAKLT